jgi:hypothetical protein
VLAGIYLCFAGVKLGAFTLTEGKMTKNVSAESAAAQHTKMTAPKQEYT